MYMNGIIQNTNNDINQRGGNQATFSITSSTYIWLDLNTNIFYVMQLPGYGMSRYNPFTSLYAAMNEQRNIEVGFLTDFSHCRTFETVREG